MQNFPSPAFTNRLVALCWAFCAIVNTYYGDYWLAFACMVLHYLAEIHVVVVNR